MVGLAEAPVVAPVLVDVFKTIEATETKQPDVVAPTTTTVATAGSAAPSPVTVAGDEVSKMSAKDRIKYRMAETKRKAAEAAAAASTEA